MNLSHQADLEFDCEVSHVVDERRVEHQYCWSSSDAWATQQYYMINGGQAISSLTEPQCNPLVAFLAVVGHLDHGRINSCLRDLPLLDSWEEFHCLKRP